MDLYIRLSCCPSYQRNCQVNYLLKLRQKVIDQKNLLRWKDSTNCGNHLGKWNPFELAIPWDLENHLNYSFTLPRHSCFENQCQMEFDFKLHKWFVLYVSPRCITMFASKNLLDITFPKSCLLLYDLYGCFKVPFFTQVTNNCHIIDICCFIQSSYFIQVTLLNLFI